MNSFRRLKSMWTGTDRGLFRRTILQESTTDKTLYLRKRTRNTTNIILPIILSNLKKPDTEEEVTKQV